MAFDEIKRIISSVPYNLHKKEESYYHSLIYTILASSGLNVKAEEASSTGKSDIVIEFNNRVYIIEIKMDKSAKSALKQIKEKGYFSKYTQKKIILIGLNVNSEKRNIDELLIDEVKM
ncbi:PD-(D/E)XK nuclease domain-containing protein [Thermosipho africanus]|nr:PD-(D/E)XK nuclease domain-containing protein [Thermosipho africanus]